MSSGLNRCGGIFTPGLICCGSVIQAASVDASLRSVPAPIVSRDATCVRSGACWPFASVPVTAWHIAQVDAMNYFVDGVVGDIPKS